MNRIIMASIMLAAVASMVIATNQIALAKESSCDVSVGGKCVIVAKRGDIEIDRLTIVAQSNPAFNDTDLKNADAGLQGQINQLNDAIQNVTNNGITSLELLTDNGTDNGNTTG